MRKLSFAIIFCFISLPLAYGQDKRPTELPVRVEKPTKSCIPPDGAPESPNIVCGPPVIIVDAPPLTRE